MDDRQALVGTLSPNAGSQAVVSGNPALVLATRSVLRESVPDGRSLAATTADTRTPSSKDESLDWLAWEDRKAPADVAIVAGRSRRLTRGSQ